jgi:S-adenosylmethionine:tRNA ribosyltransferase-isomerase
MDNSLGPQDFSYALPEGLIAQAPAPQRQSSRLLHLVRQKNELIDRVFGDLPTLLRPGDLLVLNDTRVLPARFFARRSSGGKIEGLFVRREQDGSWLVMLRGAARCRQGEKLNLDAMYGLVLAEKLEAGQWRVQPQPPEEPAVVLGRVGKTPLPPYIRRGVDEGAGDEIDRARYQTVYARQDGAVAAPTAGLHFTPRMLEDLLARGVRRAFVTLHVGPGTFVPVKAAALAQHPMHGEWYDLPADTAAQIAQTRRDGGRVVAVGTTVVRVLETAARQGPLGPQRGWTKLFIYPPAEFAVVDVLITNFHLPASTLLMLVAAFCSPGRGEGREQILAAYRHAVAQGYRFYSYGDAMLIE